jgi:DNA gyrase subunit B
MSAEQLWETTMSPTTRKLLRVELTDAQQADEVFTLLMGDKVEPRREFIPHECAICANGYLITPYGHKPFKMS